MNWITINSKTPPENIFVNTKIDDANGPRTLVEDLTQENRN